MKLLFDFWAGYLAFGIGIAVSAIGFAAFMKNSRRHDKEIKAHRNYRDTIA